MTLDTGQVVDNRYRIVKLLGQGGMGAVYRAWDMRLNRAIALKEMIPQLGLDASMLGDLREQFQQEAQVLATLVHPNLVRVTDYFSWDGNEYLVMDYVEGEDLAGRIAREGAQEERQVLEWAGQLLDALAYCHKQGVIHRDIKPQNIIITPEGQAVLVDFGLVKLWDPSDPQTRTVMRGAGTPEYAPPEQYDMGVGHTDQRSDVYSVGATLYHALTGKLPPTATQRMASPASFVTPRRVNEAVSVNTEAVVLKALEMAMGQRYQSAEEMARALGIVPRSTVVVVPSGAKPGGKTLSREPKEAASARRGILWGMGGAGLTIGIVICLVVATVAVLIGLNAFGGGEEPTATPTLAATSSPTDTPSPSTDTPFPPTDTPVVPTATSLPTHTPEPLSGLLFEDSFSDPESGWEEWESEEGRAGYGEGYYYVIGLAEGIQVFGSGPQDFSDLAIDVYATQISAAPANINAYGVMCRVQADGDGYLLRISGDGQYAIQRIVDGSFEYLVDWTESDAINQGNATNHLHVVCDGMGLALVVNGEVLAEVEDDAFTEGGIALTVTTFESEPTEVHFDDLLVLDPDSILIQDGFSDPNSGWDVEEFDDGSLGYREGIYFIYAGNKDYYYLGQVYVSLSNVAIEVDVTQIFAPTNDNNYYGAGCRLQSDGGGYMFIISGQGDYAIYKRGGETSGEFLVDWTESDVIRQGNATNHLRAICDGTRLAIAINGELLAEVEDATYTVGDLFLVASTLEDEPTEIHFDDLLVYVP